MPKMLILSGIPASGKSTFAKQFVKENDGWVRINKDDIRRMFGEYWLPKRESLVEDAEYSIAEDAAFFGWNIIVDDTNLNPKYIKVWKDFANDFKYEIEYKEFKVSLEQALEWDSKRENPVGENVIRGFYKKYYENV